MTEIGMFPVPYARANIDIILDGKVVVDFKYLGIEIIEKQGNSAPVPQAVTSPTESRCQDN